MKQLQRIHDIDFEHSGHHCRWLQIFRIRCVQSTFPSPCIWIFLAIYRIDFFRLKSQIRPFSVTRVAPTFRVTILCLHTCFCSPPLHFKHLVASRYFKNLSELLEIDFDDYQVVVKNVIPFFFRFRSSWFQRITASSCQYQPEYCRLWSRRKLFFSPKYSREIFSFR